jgi:hypothetical protein
MKEKRRMVAEPAHVRKPAKFQRHPAAMTGLFTFPPDNLHRVTKTPASVAGAAMEKFDRLSKESEQ